MLTLNDVVMIGEKYGFSISEYKGKVYLQPVSVVGERVYLQTAAPTWKKDGREMSGKSKIVSFGLGEPDKANKVLDNIKILVSKYGNGASSPVPTPSPAFTDPDDDGLPF